MEQVRVRAAELLLAVHPERVVPDDPTAAVEAGILAGNLELGGIIVPDGEPESAVGLEDAMDRGDPILRPLQVMRMLAAVVVHIVLIADIERRIGKSQIDASVWQALHTGQAITVMDVVQ